MIKKSLLYEPDLNFLPINIAKFKREVDLDKNFYKNINIRTTANNCGTKILWNGFLDKLVDDPSIKQRTETNR